MSHKIVYSIGIFSAAFLAACGGGNDSSSTPAAEKPAATTPAPAAEVQAEAKPVVAADRGRVVFKKCQTCHTLDQDGRHKVGPNLYGTIGALAGQKEGFNYSKAMTASNIIWTDENLDAYMQRPNAFMPGNQMAFVGIRKAEDRTALIAYLKKETGVE